MAPDLTERTCTALLPLKVTSCPSPSIVVSVSTMMGSVSAIVPLQAKVTIPPPTSAASKCGSSQTVTTPSACTGDGSRSTASKTRIATTSLTRMVHAPFCRGRVKREVSTLYTLSWAVLRDSLFMIWNPLVDHGACSRPPLLGMPTQGPSPRIGRWFWPKRPTRTARGSVRRVRPAIKVGV